MIECSVYFITLIKSGIFYVGSSSQTKKRLNRHFRELENNSHHNLNLQKAWNENNEVRITVFEISDIETARKIEEEVIQKTYNSNRKHLLANIGLNSIAGDLISNHPEKENIITRMKETINNNLSNMSKEERQLKFGKIGSSNPMFGKKHSIETREKISKLHKGHSYNKGIKLSKEHIEKIRQRQKLRTGSKNSFYGKKHSLETIELLRKINTGIYRGETKKVIADGICFNSVANCARYFKISNSLVTYRIRSNKYREWLFINN